MILWHMNWHQISPVLAGVDPEIEEGGGGCSVKGFGILTSCKCKNLTNKMKLFSEFKNHLNKYLPLLKWARSILIF